MKTYFENEFFLVVEKPSGWLTVPSRFPSDPRPCLFSQLKEKGFVLPVHRLDESVSGLVLFAKTKEAQREANRWFEGRCVKKTYEAITTFTTSEIPNKGSEFFWESKISKGKRRAYATSWGKLTQTKAVYKEDLFIKGKQLGFWNLFPLTGRSHQLRYELSTRGFPIVGDILYGGEPYRPNEILLKATSLSFSTDGNAWGLPETIQCESLRYFPNE